MNEQSILAVSRGREGSAIGSQIKYYDLIDSTNRAAKQAAGSAASGTVFVASAQSAGRGRGTHSFYSPRGGLYFSVLLDAKTIEIETASVRAAASVNRALAQLSGCAPTIKWVNDIFVSGKKVCGILCESIYENNLARYVVVGIGINVETTEFAPELADIVSSLTLALGRRVACEEVLALMLDELEIAFFHESAEKLARYYTAHCNAIGRLVRYDTGSESGIGRAIGVDRCAHLRIDVGGEIISLRSGEIRFIDG